MKNLSILIFTQLCKACAELTFRHLSQNQSLELSCSPQQGLGSLTGFSLYHRSAQSQTTVLSLAEGGELRVNLEHRGRLQLRGGLASQQVNVTISHLQHNDTGLYMWELRYRNEDDSAAVASAQRTFLLVEAAGSLCHCSHRYLPLTLTIFTAAGLLLFALGWLLTETCVKPRLRQSHPIPIYEEMTRRQQTAGTPQNNYEAPAHLEEAHFPVYANPNIRQPQDEYYASPRQLALRA